MRRALTGAGFRVRGGEFLDADRVPLHLLFTGEPQGIDWADKIRFPDPSSAQVCSMIDGIPTVWVARLMEMKLSCGWSNPRRLRDVVDARRLMETHGLDKSFAGKLQPLLRTQ